MTGDPTKVLIHRLGSLVDTAIMAPVFHHLNRLWPGAEKRVLTNFPVASVAAPLQAVRGDEAFVTGYFAYPIGTRNLSAIRALARDIRRWGPDIAIYANETKPLIVTLRDGAFLKLCGARRGIGLPVSGTRRRHRIDGSTGLHERETSRIARGLEELGHIDLSPIYLYSGGFDRGWLVRFGFLRHGQADTFSSNLSLNLSTKLRTGQAQASPKAQMVRPWMLCAICLRYSGSSARPSP